MEGRRRAFANFAVVEGRRRQGQFDQFDAQTCRLQVAREHGPCRVQGSRRCCISEGQRGAARQMHPGVSRGQWPCSECIPNGTSTPHATFGGNKLTTWNKRREDCWRRRRRQSPTFRSSISLSCCGRFLQPPPEMNAESLIRTLRAYDVSLNAAAVRSAISASDSGHLVRWAAVHLTPDTLLTVDELNQCVGARFLSSAAPLTMSHQICRSWRIGHGREACHVVRPHRGSCPE